MAVAPSSSVTVRDTGYVPAAGTVRDARIPEPPEPPSKSHDRDAIVPSESDDGLESAFTVSPAAVHVNAAVGGAFAD